MWLLFETFFKYVLSSFSSFLVDIVLLQLVIYLFGHLDSEMRILLATVVSRVFSSVVNYTLNKRVVFRNEEGHGRPALKYFSLVVVEIFAVVYRLNGFPEKVFIFENSKND